MSFVIDGFDNIQKWTEVRLGTGIVQARSPGTFQASLPLPGDVAGLQTPMRHHLSTLSDLRIKLDRRVGTAGITLEYDEIADPFTGYGYRFVRDSYYGIIVWWEGGAEIFADPVPPEEIAELRITTTLTANGWLISYYYNGTLIFETLKSGWTGENFYVKLAAAGAEGLTGVNNFQSTGYVPPPPPEYNLNTNSRPSSLGCTVDGMSYTTPVALRLKEGIHDIVFPPQIVTPQNMILRFGRWENNETTPTRQINLTQDMSILGTFPSGTLSITTTPVSGRISVDGINVGQGSAAVVVESNMNHTVTFGDVSGYRTPAAQIISVGEDLTRSVTGTYEQIPVAEGTLLVRTENQAGQLIQGPILVNGVEVGRAQYQSNYPAGTSLTVSFGALSGYVSPTSRQVTIVDGQTTTIVGIYTAIYSVTLTVTLRGVPYPGATVRVISGPTTPLAQITDNNGQVRFDNLATGAYVFEASNENMSGRITLDPSITAAAEIPLAIPTPIPDLLPAATLAASLGSIVGIIIYCSLTK